MENFEKTLIKGLQPIRYYALASAIYALFENNIYDQLKGNPLSIDEISKNLNLDRPKLEGFLLYLKNENVISIIDKKVGLTPLGKELDSVRPWYTMLIGGYGKTFLEISEKIPYGKSNASRDAGKVGIGSCGISHYDALPLTKSLLNKLPVPPKSVLDLGCGNAYYLIELCKMFPKIKAYGVEPDYKGYIAALELVKQAGIEIENSVKLYNSDAIDFLNSKENCTPDVLILGFVLHEILGQAGRESLRSFLLNVMERYPDIYIVVIEVENKITEPATMKHGLALAYYNPYYLLHYFTSQQLESDDFWKTLFDEVGLRIIDQQTVDNAVDSTKLEIGYLLGKKR